MSFSVKASLISTRQCQTDSLLDSLGYYKKNNNPYLSPDWWPTETITFLKSLIFITFFFYFTSLIGSKLKKKKCCRQHLISQPCTVHICIVRVRCMLKETFAITADVEKRFIPKKTTTAAF